MTNSLSIPKELDDLDKAVFLVNLSDKAVSATRALLYKIFEEKSWAGRYSSWAEFVESGLAKSQSWASKQLAVHEYFTLKGGIPEEQLELDTERLYMSSKLEGTPQQNLSRAKVLSRAELRAERQESEPHPFEPAPPYCKVCGGAESSHA